VPGTSTSNRTTALLRGIAMVRAGAHGFVADRVPRSAAALSFYSLFSLVPLLFLLAAVAGFVFRDPGAVEEVVSQVTDVAGEEIGDTIESLLDTVRAQRGSALSIGLVLAVFSASSVFQQTQAVLSVIFRVPEERRRTGAVGWLVRRGIGAASAVGLALAAFTPIAAVGAIESVIGLIPDDLAWLRHLLRFGVPVVSVLVLMGVAGLTFQVLTAIEIPWKAAVRGGGVTAILGSAAASLVGIYLAQASSTGTLGALGGVAILLVFFNVLWVVYLFGAEITKVYADYLVLGEIEHPSTREQEILPAPKAPEESPAETRTGLTALLAGMAIGWLARRRDRTPPR
jgi:membrane protein